MKVNLAWAKLSGLGNVSFSNPTGTNTTASFTEAGDYLLRVTASDSALSSFADVRIAVRTPAMNEAPVVSAGSDEVIGLTNVVTLDGTVSDDGLPQGAALMVNGKARPEMRQYDRTRTVGERVGGGEKGGEIGDAGHGVP